MNILQLLQGGGPFFEKWQVVVDIFWLVVGGGGWLWVVVDGGGYILAGGGWWWMVLGGGGYILAGGGWRQIVVGGGIVSSDPHKNARSLASIFVI